MPITHADAQDLRQRISEGFVIVDFYGTSCVPCKLFARVLEDIEAEIPFLDIVKINTTENPEVAEEYGIMAVPTVHFYKDGRLVHEHVGVMQPDQVKEVLAEHMYS